MSDQTQIIELLTRIALASEQQARDTTALRQLVQGVVDAQKRFQQTMADLQTRPRPY